MFTLNKYTYTELNITLPTVGPAWVLEQTLERRRRELEAEDRENAERLAKARKKEAEMRKMARAHVRKKQVCTLIE